MSTEVFQPTSGETAGSYHLGFSILVFRFRSLGESKFPWGSAFAPLTGSHTQPEQHQQGFATWQQQHGSTQDNSWQQQQHRQGFATWLVWERALY